MINKTNATGKKDPAGPRTTTEKGIPQNTTDRVLIHFTHTTRSLAPSPATFQIDPINPRAELTISAARPTNVPPSSPFSRLLPEPRAVDVEEVGDTGRAALNDFIEITGEFRGVGFVE